MLWNSIGSFIYLFGQWIITLLVVRLASDYSGAGYLNLAITITSIFGSLATFNLRTYIISDHDAVHNAMQYVGFRVISCSASFAFCCIYALFFDYDVYQYTCIVLYMVFRVMEAATDCFYAFQQRELRMDIGGKSMIMRGVLSVVAFGTVFFIFQDTMLGIIGMLVVSGVVIVFFDIPQARRFTSIKPKFSLDMMKRLFIDGGLITLTSLLSDWVVTYVRQMVDMILGTSAIGIYATVAAPVVIIQVGISYIFNPLLPALNERYAASNKKGYFQYVFRVFACVAVIAVLGVVLSIALGEPVLEFLYGQGIADYSYLLPTLVLLTALNALQWFVRTLLVMQRVLVPPLLACLPALILCVVFVTPCIQANGLMGANYIIIGCYAASTVITLLIFFISTRRHFRESSER